MMNPNFGNPYNLKCPYHSNNNDLYKIKTLYDHFNRFPRRFLV